MNNVDPGSAGVPPATWRAGGPRSQGVVPLLLLAMFALGLNLRAAEPVALSGRAMGTTWSVKFIQPASPLDPEDLRRRVAGRLEQLEQMFSTYRDTSEIARFSASRSTGWLPVSAEVAGVAARAREISVLTEGAFDVTVAPLVALWGFGPDGRRATVPAESEIVAARQHVGWRRLEIRAAPPALRKTKPEVAIDFSSFAKGHAADAVGQLLADLGATRHFVQVGGDMKTGGLGPDDREWRAGIEEPRDRGAAIACIVGLAGQALSTSGDYRNFVMLEGKRYGHIIDPRTARPASSKLAAVSVVHASAAESSALATALFVLGAENGVRLAERENLACVFFVRTGDGFARITTPAMGKYLRQRR